MSGTIFGRLCLRRGMLMSPQTRLSLVNSSKWLTTSSVTQNTSAETFWDKNKRLNRPMSPHLTIYKPQLTSLLSVTHRGTGLALSVLTSGFAIGMMTLPGSFPHYLNVLQAAQLGPALIFSAKLILAFPFFFHFANGIRHLAWDMGAGFKLRELYLSGYTVVGASLLLSVIAAAM